MALWSSNIWDFGFLFFFFGFILVLKVKSFEILVTYMIIWLMLNLLNCGLSSQSCDFWLQMQDSMKICSFNFCLAALKMDKKEMNWIWVLCFIFLFVVVSFMAYNHSTKCSRWLIVSDLCWYILFIFDCGFGCLDLGYGRINYLLMVVRSEWLWLYTSFLLLLLVF